METEYFALRGVALLKDTIDKVASRLNPDLQIIGVLPTMFDPRTLHSREVLATVQQAFGDTVFHTVINRTVKFPDAAVAGEPITAFAPGQRRRGRLPPAGPGGPVEVTTPTEALTEQPAGDAPSGFSVRVGEFEGPFDLLLTLISKHKLEVTELALAHGHRRVHRLHPRPGPRVGPRRGQRLPGRRGHAARPQGRAAAAVRRGGGRGGPRPARGARPAVRPAAAVPRVQGGRRPSSPSAWPAPAKRFPRTVGLEPQFAALLPEVLIGIGPEQFAAMAARALAPKPVPEVSIAHIHMQRVSVREQAAIIVDRLRRHQTTTFRALIADCDTTLLVIGRFLALLELYREQVVAFEQITPLGDLTIRWTGADETRDRGDRRVRRRARGRPRRRRPPRRTATTRVAQDEGTAVDE